MLLKSILENPFYERSTSRVLGAYSWLGTQGINLVPRTEPGPLAWKNALWPFELFSQTTNTFLTLIY